MEIKLDMNQWHVRLYFCCREVWNTFRDGSDRYKYQPNLCTYLRTIFIYAPLAITAQIALIVGTIYVLIIFPITNMGWAGFGYEVLVVAIFASIIIGFVYLKKKRAENRHRHHGGWFKKPDDDIDFVSEVDTSPKKTKGPGLIEVIYMYLVAAKQKFCPLITFTNNKE